MSIASRIEEMYTHVGEVYDTITNVELPEDKNIENIPNTIKDSYLKIMNEGYQEIWDNWDKREATITDGTINGTEEAPMSLTYKGNTYQYTADVAGKNLFNFNSTARTRLGTLTISDDTLTLAGGGDAAQVWWGIDVSNYTGNITISYSELTGATMHESDNKLSYCFMSSIPTNWNNMGTLTDVDKTNKYATTALGGGNYLILVLQAGAGNAFVDGWSSVSEVQVELGSTPTSYERFAGATPTPSLPSPVQVVSGDNSINVCGKNLAQKQTGLGSYGGSETTTVITDYAGREYSLIEVQPSTQYTILRQNTNSTNFRYFFYDTKPIKNTTLSIGGGYINDTSASKTFTTPSNAKWLFVQWSADGTNYSAGNIQIALGTDTTYEPYQSASYPISLGVENLFPRGLTQRDTTSVYTSSIPVMPNTTYSIDTSLSDLKIYNIYQDADKNTIDNSDWMNIPTTFTTINGCYYLQIMIGKSDSSAITTSEVEGKIDLTKGTTPQRITDTPIELLKIGTYQDKIDKSTGRNLFGISKLVTGGTYEYYKFKEIDDNSYYTLSIKLKSGGTVKYMSIGFANGYTVPLQNYSWLMNAGVMTGSSTTQSDGFHSINNLLNGTYLNYIVIYKGSGNTLQDLFDNYDIQLVKGNTYLPYEEYTGITGWYLKKEIGKVVLNGSENWALNSLSSGSNYLYWLNSGSFDAVITNMAEYIDSASLNRFYVNNFTKSLQTGTETNNGYMTLYKNASGTIKWILFNYSNATTVEAFKNWVSSNNIILYYQLATPTYETITDTTLIGQLEALKKSYEGQTNISQLNNDLPFELDVVALSDGTVSTLGFSLGNPLSSSQPEEEEPETLEEVLEEPVEEE